MKPAGRTGTSGGKDGKALEQIYFPTMPDYESPSGLSDSANASASFDKARIEEALETGLANNTSMASRGAIVSGFS